MRQHSDGMFEWTSAITGRTYTTYPRGTTGQWRGTTTGRSYTTHPGGTTANGAAPPPTHLTTDVRRSRLPRGVDLSRRDASGTDAGTAT